MLSRNNTHAALAIVLFCLVNPVSAETEDDCRILADPDTLGLGVRLGLYFLTLSNLLLALVRWEEAADSFLPSGVFFASFLVAVLYSTNRNDFPPGALISCTWYPVLIVLSMPYMLVEDAESYSERKKGHRAILVTAVLLVSGSLNIWFWFKGLDIQNEAQCMEPRVFFFANLPARGNIRILFRILSLAFVLLLCFGIIQGLWESRKESARIQDSAAATIAEENTEVSNVPTQPSLPLPSSTIPTPVMQPESSVSSHKVSHEGYDVSNVQASGIIEPGVSTTQPLHPLPSPPVPTVSPELGFRASVLKAFHEGYDEPNVDRTQVSPAIIDRAVATTPTPVPTDGMKLGIWGQFREGFREGFRPTRTDTEMGDISKATIPTLKTPISSTPQTSPAGNARINQLTTDTTPIQREPPSIVPSVLTPNLATATAPPQSPVPSTFISPSTPRLPSVPRREAVKIANTKAQKEMSDAVYFAVFLLIFYVIASELQLKWNHLDGIDSINTTGQIIPLAIGSMSFIRAVVLVWWRSLMSCCWRFVQTVKRRWASRSRDGAIPAI